MYSVLWGGVGKCTVICVREMIYGGAKGMKNFVMYTLGTGVGSGLVVNGNLVYGHDGFAGECGHSDWVLFHCICFCHVIFKMQMNCRET